MINLYIAAGKRLERAGKAGKAGISFFMNTGSIHKKRNKKRI